MSFVRSSREQRRKPRRRRENRVKKKKGEQRFKEKEGKIVKLKQLQTCDQFATQKRKEDRKGEEKINSSSDRRVLSLSARTLFHHYVVDAADHENLAISRSELHDLLSKPSLSGIPLLVLGNKIDKPESLSKQALTDQMELKLITDREVCSFMISCKNSTNIDSVIDWLVNHSKSKK